MTTERDFERELGRWLDAQAPVKGPVGLHAAAMDRAGAAHQRPGWTVALRGDAFPARGGAVGRRPRALVLLIVALALVVIAAAIAGAIRVRPTPLGANGVIAYSIFENKQRAGQTSFSYLINGDGSGNRRFATGTCPKFTADGSLMTYRSHWAGDRLTLASAEGTWRRELPVAGMSYRDDGYALSPDSTRVAWERRIGEERSELWVAPLAAGDGVRIVPASDIPTESFGMLAWSPDGTTIAFEGRVSRPQDVAPSYRRAIYLVGASGGPVRHLTDRLLGSGWSSGLAWSPDGRSIAYLGLPDGSSLPTDPPFDDSSFEVAPDMFVIAVDGTSESQLTKTPSFESRPSWSPDGSRIGYLTTEDGEAIELAVLPMDGLDPTGPPVRGPVSQAFSWSPDGTTLLSIDATTIRSIDAALERPPTILVDLRTFPVDPTYPNANGTDYEHCPPSWQWLRP